MKKDERGLWTVVYKRQKTRRKEVSRKRQQNGWKGGES